MKSYFQCQLWKRRYPNHIDCWWWPYHFWSDKVRLLISLWLTNFADKNNHLFNINTDGFFLLCFSYLCPLYRKHELYTFQFKSMHQVEYINWLIDCWQLFCTVNYWNALYRLQLSLKLTTQRLYTAFTSYSYTIKLDRYLFSVSACIQHRHSIFPLASSSMMC